MASLKIKKGDTVRVISGKDKDKEGKVLAVNAKANTAVVEGINIIKKHMKANTSNQDGGIVMREAPINLSKLMYVHNGKAVRIGFSVNDKGKKVRVAKVSKDAYEVID